VLAMARPWRALDLRGLEPYSAAMSDKSTKPDWRTLPRKPAGDRLSTQIVARATASERAEIYALAAAAGLPVSRYIVLSALGRRPK